MFHRPSRVDITRVGSRQNNCLILSKVKWSNNLSILIGEEYPVSTFEFDSPILESSVNQYPTVFNENITLSTCRNNKKDD